MVYQVKYLAKFMIGVPIEAEDYEKAINLGKDKIGKGMELGLAGPKNEIDIIEKKIEFSGVDTLDHWEF